MQAKNGNRLICYRDVNGALGMVRPEREELLELIESFTVWLSASIASGNWKSAAVHAANIAKMASELDAIL